MTLPDNNNNHNIFLINPDLIGMIARHVENGIIKPRYEIYVRDSVTGHTHMLLVDEPDGTLDTVLASIKRGVGLQVNNPFEDYFWLFWRGWMGHLDVEIVRELPVGQHILERVEQGKPLRGGDLERLADALGWEFANTTAGWGENDADWQQWTLTAPHKKQRRMVADYVKERMAVLYGEDYGSAPQPDL
ncbi:MAG: hypothetical protein JXJ17_17480 [Anaerolineae bacterium]|nr:hypothetical protein [Anaerolineae bacterium]